MSTIEPREPSPKDAVDTLFGLARMPMQADEYERMQRLHPVIREHLASLRIPETRYLEPAMLFHAR
jgi:hypothetical protein